MRLVCALLMIGAAMIASTHAQTDAFDGTWKVDLSKSQALTGHLPKQELVILKIIDGGERATNDIIGPDGVRRRSEYTAKYNDGKWYQPKNAETGKPSGASLMMVRVDPRTELRIGRRADGTYGGTIVRQVSKDGKSMTISWSGADGRIHQYLHLDKQ
jgi:hypothetical protein